MNFFKKHWIGIIIFAVIWIIGWKIVFYISPNLLLMRLIMPTVVIGNLLMISKIIHWEYHQWPWRFKWNDWKIVIEDLKQKA
jgi:hypothetical protein